MLTTREAAAILECSTSRVLQHIKAGRLLAMKHRPRLDADPASRRSIPAASQRATRWKAAEDRLIGD